MNTNVRTGRNFVFNFLNTFCSVALPVVVFSYVSRILSVEGIGAVNFSKNIITYFSYIATLGIMNYGTREIAKIHNEKNKVDQIFSELWLINFMSTFSAYLLLTVFCFITSRLKSYNILIWIFSISMLFSFLGAKWLYMGIGEYGILAKSSIFTQIVSLVLIFIFVKKPEDIWKYALLNVISTSGFNLICFIGIRNRVTFHRPKVFELLKHIKPVFVLWFMEMVVSVSTTLDTVMLGFLRDDYEVGLYTAGVKIYRIASMLISSFSAVVMPSMCECYADKRINEMKSYISEAIDMICMFSIPVFAMTVVLNKEMILILSGSVFIYAAPLVRILAFLIVIHPLSELIVARVNIATGMEKKSVFIFSIGAIVNVFGNIVLIPRLGARGASISTAISETIMLIMGIWIARRYLKIESECKKNIIFYVEMSLLIVLCTMLFRKYFGSSIVLLCIYCVVVACIYVLILIKSGNKHVRYMINAFIRK